LECASRRIIDGERALNEVVEAAIAGSTLAVGGVIWLLAGYLIQRFLFQNPAPTAGSIIATSLSASMLLFSLVALLTFHVRYNYLGAADVVHTIR
jgi:hypothetical protein